MADLTSRWPMHTPLTKTTAPTKDNKNNNYTKITDLTRNALKKSLLSGSFGRRKINPELPKSGVARGLLQGRPLQLPMGWGVGKELTKTLGQLLRNSVYKILLGRFRTVFLLARACTKSGWLEVDQELDMG